ncbi:sulfate adenylyltransferase [Virgibacillus alimentarius]|uniref:Sulfate adenylyltransferase n=1 Tax=Virgibacillus alimentarius TaxID=698769 RepID=A0ABS4SAC8_9BACI|nr:MULTISPECIES: sulfate adenylyltransferase [Virgibacillus]MBP2258460.1 sulfate adenylyltransferase [Virgibacillus alimentarius]HLR67070.1 sulfate adenylyltransferase [Virgibacillus sp.]
MSQKSFVLDQEKMASYPQQPHGGKLVNRLLTGKKRDQEMERAKQLPMIVVDMEAVITLEMIATGVLSPNEGFMNKEDYKSVLTEGRLKNGLIWPTPLSFAPTGDRNKQVIDSLSVGDEVCLADDTKEPVAILKLEDIFAYDRDFRASHLFGTTDRSHPGVDSIYRRMGDTALGGPITMLRRVHWGPFEQLRLEPKDTFELFYEEKNFRSVGGFITGANPMHRGHEYIHRNALEELDGLLVQPLVEMAKREYTRPEFRMLAYRSVMDTYYPKERSVLAPLRVTYIFAGPREAVLHALIMKNYGCTHALIGRDHAGIGDFYDKYASHSVFDKFTEDELGIDIRLFHEVFYCTRCDSPSTEQTCPHDKQYRINISGTGVRELLRYGVLPPKEIVRPESARIAMQGIQPKGVDEHHQAVNPVGKAIKSIFPSYLEYSRLGGPKRKKPLEVEQLTIDDLEAAITDVRSNADRIYKEIYDEFSYASDIRREVQPEWVADARESVRKQQQMVIDYLEEKVDKAPETASDEYMYQDKEEAERELEVARKIFEDTPSSLRSESIKYRTWNPMPYDRYRS